MRLKTTGPKAARYVRRLMLRANLLVGTDGNPISDGVGELSAVVSRVAENSQRAAVQYQALVIVGALGYILYDQDYYYLGLVLFRKGGNRAIKADQLRIEVDALLKELVTDQRLKQVGEKIVCATAPTRESGDTVIPPNLISLPSGTVVQ